MATQVPYKIYRASANDRYDLLPDLNATNSSYAASQLQEGSVQDFMTDYQANKSYYDDYFNRNTTPGIKEAFQQIITGGANSSPINSGYVMNNGVLTTQTALSSEAANQAAVAAGTMKNIGTAEAPMYVPTGSAGDYASQGMSYEDQLKQASVQQQITNQNLTPVSPAVISSDIARQEVNQNMGSLSQAEQMLASGGGVKYDDIQKQQTTFYRPDPNSEQVFNYKNQPVSYEEYIAQGGKEDFSNVVAGPSPLTITQTGIENNPAMIALTEKLNQQLASGTADGTTKSLIDQANSLAERELATTAAARAAADSRQYKAVTDLMNEIKEIKATRTSLIAQISAALKKSQAEKDSEQRLSNLQLSQRAGQIKIDGQPIPMEFLIGQRRELDQQAELKISNEVANLKRLSGERLETLDALKFMYDASANDFSQAVETYKLTAPDNIYTDVDSQGDLITVTQNPLTGEIVRRNLGKVGDNKAWEKNKELSLQNPGNNPFFSLDGRTIKNRQTGREYESVEQFIADGGNANFSNVDWMSGDKQIMKNATLGLMDKYWDAGILPTDDYTTAVNKAKTKSRIYADQVRGPAGDGPGSGDTSAARRDARVKQIIAAYPHWQAAATQIDREYGAGTATLYDPLLKASFDNSRVQELQRKIDAGTATESESMEWYGLINK